MEEARRDVNVLARGRRRCAGRTRASVRAPACTSRSRRRRPARPPARRCARATPPGSPDRCSRAEPAASRASEAPRARASRRETAATRQRVGKRALVRGVQLEALCVGDSRAACAASTSRYDAPGRSLLARRGSTSWYRRSSASGLPLGPQPRRASSRFRRPSRSASRRVERRPAVGHRPATPGTCGRSDRRCGRRNRSCSRARRRRGARGPRSECSRGRTPDPGTRS